MINHFEIIRGPLKDPEDPQRCQLDWILTEFQKNLEGSQRMATRSTMLNKKKIFVDFSRRFESVRNWKPPAISEAFFCHFLKRFLWFETFRCRKKKKKVRTSRSWLFFITRTALPLFRFTSAHLRCPDGPNNESNNSTNVSFKVLWL